MTQLAGPAEASGQAVMLQGDTDSEFSGLAWASLDQSCRLHYRLRIQGPEVHTVNSLLELEDYPVQNLKALPLFPSQKMGLQNCVGANCAGHADKIHKLTMARLDSGDAALLLTGQPHHTFSLKGGVVGVSSPRSCLPSYARNDLESIPGYLSDLAEQDGDAELAKDLRQKCVYEGSVYEPGAMWEATHQACSMCSCQRGQVKCEAVLCPPTNCSDPVRIEGECCASCGRHSDTGRSCTFGDDNILQPAGSRWHPYLPPFGFSQCTVCTCQERSLTVECVKKQCPPLTECLHSEAIREDPRDCCKVCPTKTPTAAPSVPSAGSQGDQAKSLTGEELLALGGCRWKGNHHVNGAVWHPTVLPWGVMKCVTCSCKDGETNCRKKRCPKLKCKLQIREDANCCARCAKGKKEEARAQRSMLQQTRDQKRKRRRRRLLRLRQGQSQPQRLGLPLRSQGG